MNYIFHIMLFSFSTFSTFFAIVQGDIANTAVWLSGAAYCDKNDYKTMQLAGPATGFIVSDVLYDPKTDLQGYTGVLNKSIFVAYRGSSSVLNWLSDFEVVKKPYLTYPECNCTVHKGFYTATTNLKESTIKSVQNLKAKYGYSDVIVTGHSLGAAIAQLIGMELSAVNIKNQVYNFGQPRIGDNKYAGFVNTITDDLWRFTHNKDSVPHLPPMSMGYLHSCREVFELESGELHMCSEVQCEDPKCADQYSATDVDSDDHSIYLGHPLDCSKSTK